MKIPSSELLSPMPVQACISDALAEAREVAVYGKTKGLDRLSRSLRLEYLWISGVDSFSARIVGQIPALRRLVIHDLRVPDLSALAGLSHLEDLAIAGSPKLKSVAGVECLKELRSLILFDNCNYDNVAALAPLNALETLCLEGGFSKPLRICSLSPLENLLALKRLRLASIRVTDGSLRPLHKLRSLDQVFIARAFSPAEFRSLAIALPNVRGEYVDSFRDPREAG